MSGHIDVSRDHGAVSLTIDRRDRANALTPQLAGALTAELRRAGDDASVRVVILRGAGDRTFCAGFDLGRVAEGAPTGLDELMEALDDCPVPTVAVLSGSAIGAGFELASRCDLRVASPGVRVGLPAVRLGVAYRAQGLAAMLAATHGDGSLLLTGRQVPIEDLKGFAHALVPAEQLEDAVVELVAELAAAAPSALSYTTRLVRHLSRPALSASVAAAFAAERSAIMADPDITEAVSARREGRAPVFADRPPGAGTRQPNNEEGER